MLNTQLKGMKRQEVWAKRKILRVRHEMSMGEDGLRKRIREWIQEGDRHSVDIVRGKRGT